MQTATVTTGAATATQTTRTRPAPRRREPHPPFRPDSARVDAILPARNHGPRVGEGFRAVGRPDMLLLHYTGMDCEDAALHLLSRGSSVVSCHYFVHGSGRVVQLLPEAVRANHAGESRWHGERDNNSRSVGIEIANPGHLLVDRGGALPHFPEAQMRAVTELCGDIATRLALSPTRVVAHSDIAPHRKLDPGEHFRWDELHAAGIGHWVAPARPDDGPALRIGEEGEAVRRLQRDLWRYGYGLERNGVFSERTRAVVAAFQRHFRPARVDGAADAGTLDTLDRLLRTAPPGSLRAAHDA